MSARLGWKQPAAWVGSVLILGVACQSLIDTNGLSDRQCRVNEKPCENMRMCASLSAQITGCGNDTCAPCALPHAFATCSEDYRCEIESCHEGYRDCNSDPQDGCEIDSAHDPEHCGGCTGMRCDEVPNGYPGCSGGVCVLGGCAFGFDNCDGFVANGCEAEIWTDTSCGGCDAGPCPTDQSCDRGTCR